MKEENLPLISVIVLTYNSAEYVLSTLESIYRQDYAGLIELIIGDDCSTDGTVEICKAWVAEHKMRFKQTYILQQTTNVGVVGNINSCLKNASGKWIKDIAGDDILADNALSIMYRYAIGGDEEKVFISSAVRTFTNEAQLKCPEELPSMLGDRDIVVDLDYVFRHPDFFLPAPSFFIRHETLISIGYYPTLLRNIEDAPLMYTLIANGYKLHHITTPTVFYRIHEASITKSSGHIRMAEHRNMAFDTILLPCYDWFKRLYLNMYFAPSRYMVRTKNKCRVRYKALKLFMKILRCTYALLCFPLLRRKSSPIIR